MLQTLKRKAPRWVKRSFFVLQLHRVFGVVAYLFQWTAAITRLSRWIHAHRDLAFNDFPTTFDYQKRYTLYQFLLTHEALAEQPMLYAEFGVAAGQSFKWWAAQLRHPDSRFHGFDTFTGLPEAWGPFKKGAMSNGNAPPEMDDTRVQFHQGLFQQTLPSFLDQLAQSKYRKIIHLDADLYSATLYVLTALHPYLRSGDLILFDEFNVPTHEFGAYEDYIRSYYASLTPIAAVNNYYQVAFRVD